MMKRIGIWLLLCLISLLVATGCRKGESNSSVQEVRVELSHVAEGYWHMYIYGTHSITVDTVEVDAKGHLNYKETFDLDSVDLLLLRDTADYLVLPIIPHRGGKTISAELSDKGWKLSGVEYAEQIAEWYQKIDDEGELLSYLRDQYEMEVTPLLVADGLERYGAGERGSEWISLYGEVTRWSDKYSSIVGMRLSAENIQEYRQDAPYNFPVSGKEDRMTYKELMGKSALMAMNFFALCPEDSALFAKQKAYFKQLDSLSVPSFSVLLNDSLPKEIKVKSSGTKRYFLIDSIGESQRYLREQSITDVPLYMAVDSLRNIKGSWSECDSLIQYMKKHK